MTSGHTDQISTGNIRGDDGVIQPGRVPGWIHIIW